MNQDGNLEQHRGENIVCVSNRDLKPKVKGELVARLRPRTARRLLPLHLANCRLQLPVLRVIPGTAPFQLPEDCLLLAIEGEADVVATGQGCMIWYAENLRLRAGVAVLGAGHAVELCSNVLWLLPTREIQDVLPELPAHQFVVERGRVEYLFLCHQNPCFDQPGPGSRTAELVGSGKAGDFIVRCMDAAISGYGNLSVLQEIWVEEWLREELNRFLWQPDPTAREEQVDQLLSLVCRASGTERYTRRAG